MCPRQNNALVWRTVGGTGQAVGDAILLTRLAPEPLAGYRRYCRDQAGMHVRASVDNDAALTVVFDRACPLAPEIIDARRRQIDMVLGGI